MLEVVASKIPASSLAVHCHDTYGQALSNILTSLQVSIYLKKKTFFFVADDPGILG
jgi:hypothetical protein